MKTINRTRRNIVRFINTGGKGKRVKTVTDDYGNQVHVVKKKTGGFKQKSAGGLYGAKVRATQGMYIKDTKKIKSKKELVATRHRNSTERREKRDGNITGSHPYDYRKKLYHATAAGYVKSTKNLKYKKSLHKAAQQVHGLSRKSRKS